VIHIYATNHSKNIRISEAFAKGCGGKIVPPAPLLPGDVFMYGALRGLMPTLLQAQAEGRTWYYADNCYLGPRNLHFRVTRNARQHDGTGEASPERWERLGLELRPWRKSGKRILICPPGPDYGQLWGIDVKAWLRDQIAAIERATDRPYRIRERSLARSTDHPLSADLENCWALVTCTSNVAVDALLAGVPVFCTHPCAAYLMGTPDLTRIEDPVMPDDRLRWVQVLAANQWTLEEQRAGTCWRELHD
jgi:hypothetical protein